MERTLSDNWSPEDLYRVLRVHGDVDRFVLELSAFIAERSGTECVGIFLRSSSQGKLSLAGAGDSVVGDLASVQKLAERSVSSLNVITHREDTLTHVAVPVRVGAHIVGSFVVCYEGEPVADDTIKTLVDLASIVAPLLEDSAALTDFRNRSDVSDQTALRFTIPGRKVSEGETGGMLQHMEQDAVALHRVIAEGSGDNGRTSVRRWLKQFDRSVRRTNDQLEELAGRAGQSLSDVASLIFSAHILMLHDDNFSGDIRSRIQSGEPPHSAISSVVEQYAELFGGFGEDRLSEKAQDVRDLGLRLVRNLSASRKREADYANTIVAARHMYPSELMKLAVQQVAGVVFRASGVTAHIAILAQSLGVPVMATADPRLFLVPSGTPVHLDAGRGKLVVRPPATTGETASGEGESVSRSGGAARTPGTITLDGRTGLAEAEAEPGSSDVLPISVHANINLYSDVVAAVAHGADGIGLYRSEFPFIIRNVFLSEDEQFRVYSRIAQGMPGKSLVLRTADIGGDKLLDVGSEPEKNPFLGVRGIRYSLANPDMFRVQLRAMLRAGYGQDLGIMFPMVSSVEEVEEAKSILDEVNDALTREGREHNAHPRVGTMIELPAAVEAAEDLAAICDFISIGTNDLIMYMLAVDRTNERLSQLYRAYHPAVLRTVKRIIDAVLPTGRALSVCGDAAADPYMLPFLAGSGIRSISVAPRGIPQVRALIGSRTALEMKTLASEMSEIRSIREMEHYLSARS